MSHELAVVNGVASMAMAEGGEAPWWVVDGKMKPVILPKGSSVLDFVKGSTLDRLIEETEVFHMAPDNGPVEIPGVKLIRRAFDGEPYGVVSDEYRIVQPIDAFKRFERILGEHATLDTAGSLYKGKRFWGSAKLADFTAAGDKHRGYLLMTSGHDGKRSFEIGGTAVRVVCANTLRMAVGDSIGKSRLKGGQKVSHRGDVDAKMDQASDEVAKAFGFFDSYAKAAEAMATTAIPMPETRDIVRALLLGTLGEKPKAQEDREAESRSLVAALLGQTEAEVLPALSSRMEEAQDDILGRIVGGMGQEKHRGSAWAVYNGISEHYDHGRMQSAEPDRQMLYRLEGAGHQQKQKAFAYLRDRSGVRTVTVEV